MILIGVRTEVEVHRMMSFETAGVRIVGVGANDVMLVLNVS